MFVLVLAVSLTHVLSGLVHAAAGVCTDTIAFHHVQPSGLLLHVRSLSVVLLMQNWTFTLEGVDPEEGWLDHMLIVFLIIGGTGTSTIA